MSASGTYHGYVLTIGEARAVASALGDALPEPITDTAAGIDVAGVISRVVPGAVCSVCAGPTDLEGWCQWELAHPRATRHRECE